ncbi:double-stranded RNA binding motif-containing protein [Phanerochaete sordida]|uniref:Double-stranded RNA binding motif-containing protein n=1 Tax=Phanerochaete sordida TaxID=48140 RepID=A0A9P3FZR3_9APHY|nr:double-stranded RNA binding motif-containing protein [Phanerochaete sordida]
MSQPDHWRLRLNNLLQSSWGTQSLRWEAFQNGPQNSAPWVAVAYIKNVEWGRGTAHSLGAAKEEAARVAYRALHRQLYGIDPQ